MSETGHQNRRGHVIDLVDGDVLMPRRDLAHDVMRVSERSVARLNLPTTYIGGLAYVLRDASLRIIAERVRRRHEQKPRRRAS